MFIERLYDRLPKGWEEFFLDEDVKDELIIIDRQLEMINVFPGPDYIMSIFYTIHPSEINVVMFTRSPDKDGPENQRYPLSQNEREMPNKMSRIIFNNLKNNIDDYHEPNNGCKLEWIARGVFMFYQSPTICRHRNSIQDELWIPFIIKLLQFIGKVRPSCVYTFMFWGTTVYEKEVKYKLGIIKSVSPDHRFFVDSTVFKDINNMLKDNNIEPIDWRTSNV